MNSDKISVRRSFIFTPGLNPEMFPKAIASGADMVCIELEDGIAIKDKDEAIAFGNISGLSPGVKIKLRLTLIFSEFIILLYPIIF